MTSEQDFRTAIAASPDDVGLRLVFADFLEEQGKCTEAELIRIDVELAERLVYPLDVVQGATTRCNCQTCMKYRKLIERKKELLKPTELEKVRAEMKALRQPYPSSTWNPDCLYLASFSYKCEKCNRYEQLQRREKELLS